ncbi:MAG: YdiU family protein [Clostridiales bacterium]|nr:YdiU family protein [Clostridiales bacterium]
MEDKKTKLEAGWKLENSYSRLPKSFFSSLKPTPVRSPKLIILNHPLSKDLGLSIEALKSDDGVSVLAGNQIPEGAFPLAQAYAGHQFGYFNMLGDGRAILLGEQETPLGERLDIQLKGSGKTPYSRGGDGRATLGPMLREYIISEAMHALGIASSRSLAVVSTGESITRETLQPGAVLTRIASSHLRVGTFQYVSQWGTVEELRTLADYTLQRHFPGVEGYENKYVFLLREVIKRQASLIAKWQLVGFVHGVMNTDNMAISGETIDYGPCAFMDSYNEETVFSSIDKHGRYAYGNQPKIAAWNLARFAETVLPLLHANQTEAVKMAQSAIEEFTDMYNNYWIDGMRKKLGIFNKEEQDKSMIEKLLSMMQKYKADYTNTFCSLTIYELKDIATFKTTEFAKWKKLWQARLERQKETKSSTHELMRKNNPALIPRNHRVEEALEAAVKQEDYSVMESLLDVLSNPYDHSKEQSDYSTVVAPSNLPYRTFCGT